MKSYSQEAASNRLLFRAGLLSAEEVAQWADGLTATLDHYDDDLANISLSAGRKPQEIDSMLLHAGEGADHISALRHLLGQMHKALICDPGRARAFARILEELRMEFWSELQLLSDFSFICGIDHAFADAELYGVGTVQSVTAMLIQETARYDQQGSTNHK